MAFFRLLPCALMVIVPLAPAHAQPAGHGPAFQPLGFGDVSYVTSNGGVAEGFVIGQLVGQFTAALTHRLTIFTELSANARSDNYTLDVERLFFRYDFTDAFKVSAGRYHTPISYWNTAYHHGLWLQTTTQRPSVIRFGTTLVPIHFVGVLAEGTIRPGSLGLGYAAGLGNGRNTNLARAGDGGDANDARAATFALHWRPPALIGFQIGGGAYFDRIPAVSEEPELRERIFSAHVVWTPGAPELIGEYTHIRHTADVARATTLRTNAFYAQASWGLHGAAAGVRPYGRYEKIDAMVPEQSAFAALGEDYESVIVGVRYDFDLLAALKGEYRREKLAVDDWTNTFVVQASFAISGLGAPAME